MTSRILVLGTGSIAIGVLGELITTSILNPHISIEVYIYSRCKDRIKGFLLDLEDALTLRRVIDRSNANIKFKSSYDIQEVGVVDFIINCMGEMSMPGVLKSRISLFEENCVLIDLAVVLNNFHLSTNTKVINVSNPVDEINYYLYQKLNLNKENIYGIGLSHDFARIINELGYENIEIRGKHGEDIEIYKEDIKIEVDYENRSRGMRILELKKGIPPVFAPVASIMSLLNAFIFKKEILTYASVWCRETEGFTGKKIKISYCSQALKHE